MKLLLDLCLNTRSEISAKVGQAAIVPEGQSKIARHFNAGDDTKKGGVPEGRWKFLSWACDQASLWGADYALEKPGTEVPGYFRGVPPGLPRKSRSGFSLVEMLTAVVVFLILGLILISMAGQAMNFWTRGQSHILYRQRARTALDYMGQDLRQATLPVNANSTGSGKNLQLVINPSGVTSTSKFPDNFFWQAPVATDTSKGDLAEVGYYVQWTGTQSNLYRFLVNPSDSTNYKIYSQSTWVTDSVLQAVNPTTNPTLFLQNVLGLWVAAFAADGTAYAGGTTFDSGDSRTQNRLPAYVQISLVLIDSSTAAHVPHTGTNPYQSLYAAGAGSSDTVQSAQTFIAALPANIRPGVNVETIKVQLDNYK